MIKFCKSWCEGIIVAVIVSIIIESILPEGKNKKYVKVIVGIYIIFTILNPILGKLDIENIKFQNKLNLESIEVASVDTSSIQEMYTSGIEETLKNAIFEKFGYSVMNLKIEYDEKFENIERITFVVTEKGVLEIQKIQIGNQVQNEKNNNQYENVKDYISENYGLDKSKITIWGRGRSLKKRH